MPFLLGQMQDGWLAIDLNNQRHFPTPQSP
jgi:hypothetical protein